jgi:hypothetical protein
VWREQGRRDSPNPIRELFDAAAQGYNLQLKCRGCRRFEVLDAHAVWHLFQRKGWRDLLRDVPARFRCRNCGRKPPFLELVHEDTTCTDLPMPSEAEWKRELRRRR